MNNTMAICAPQDRSKININEDQEVAYWTQELRCTKEDLQGAVEYVGRGVAKVRGFLKGDG